MVMANPLSFLFGQPAQFKQVSKFGPQQMDVLNQLLGMGVQGLQNPLSGFGPIEQEARSGFQQQTLPSIAERFGGMGQNRLSSGAFRSQLAGAGTDLETRLASLRSQYGQNQQQNMLNLLGLGLTPQFDTVNTAAEPGLLQNILQTGGQYAPLALGALGGGAGTNWLDNFVRLLGATQGGR
jgi:hypothetical protein